MIRRMPFLAVLLGLPVWGWSALHKPLYLAGLAALLALSLIIIPNLAVWALFTGQRLRFAVIPKRWRASYRHEHGREGAASAYITERQRRIVNFADRNRCVYRKHRRRPVQVDHIIPWAGGGPTKLHNLMNLCGPCNLVKLNYSRDRDGYEHYRAENRNPGNILQARRILAAERRHRRSLIRGIRLAWAMSG